jgi:DNA-binding transcriptional LysR family regulator
MVARMELRQLRNFVAVAETGNISRAAQKIFLTQPALSRQIKALEEEIGQCLLERQAHSIRLTPAGEALLNEARELLKWADEIPQRIRTAANALRLRVGYAPSLASGLLSVAVQNFTQTHPAARVELFDLSTNEMLHGLEAKTLDVALTVGTGEERRGLIWTPLLRAKWQVAVNRRSPLARRAKLTAADLAGERLLAYCQRDYPEYWKLLTEWMRAQGQRAAFAGEYDGVNSLLSAVESGLGTAVVTSSAGRLAPRDVKMKELGNAPEPLCIAAGFRADQAADKALAVFVEELRAAAKAFV